RDVHDEEPDVRPLLVGLLAPHPLQRRGPEPALGEESPHERGRAVRDVVRGQHRHVAGAVRDHRDEPAPRLPALVLGYVRGHEVRLRGLPGPPRALRHPHLPVRALPARDLHLRDAHDPARGRGSERGPSVPARPPIYGLLAEFRSPHEVVEAAKRVREAGYRMVDGYSPYPIEELSEALHFHRSPLPKLVLAGGILGMLAGWGLEYWASVIEYPMNIGGRPVNSWPAFIVPAFETTILFAAGTAVFGMLALNGLPHPYH